MIWTWGFSRKRPIRRGRAHSGTNPRAARPSILGPDSPRESASKRPMNRLSAAILAAALVAPPGPVFRFHTDEFWLNLHHFLYVLGRAEAKMPDASREAVVGAPAEAERGLARVSAEELKYWKEAVAYLLAA